jgi:fructokinase
MQRVFAVGETVYDIIFRDGQPIAAKPGGSMLNTAVSLGRLGVETFFISEYGPDNDPVGKIVNDFLYNNQVNTQFIRRLDNSKTAIALAFLDNQNDAAYSFYRNPIKQDYKGDDIEFKEDDIFLFGSFYSIKPESRSLIIALLRKAHEAGSVIIYDPNFRNPHLKDLPQIKPWILENLNFPDIVRASDEDFYLIFQAANGSEAYDALKRQSNSSLIYTQNRNGVDLYSQDHKFHMPVPEIEPLSTIGAGDNFNAGIIWTLVREGIGKKDLEHLSQNQWKKIIGNAIRFSTDVCMSYDNYISVEFAVEMLSE